MHRLDTLAHEGTMVVYTRHVIANDNLSARRIVGSTCLLNTVHPQPPFAFKHGEAAAVQHPESSAEKYCFRASSYSHKCV